MLYWRKVAIYLTVLVLASSIGLIVMAGKSSSGMAQLGNSNAEPSKRGVLGIKYIRGGNYQDPTATINAWVSHGPEGGQVISLVVDPSNSAVVYAGTYLNGVFKSTDSGNSWTRANAGIENIQISALVLSPTDPNIIFAGTSGKLFKSIDGAISWTQLDGFSSSNTVTALTIDPKNPSTMYAGAYGDGLFKSTDAGSTWEPTNNGLTSQGVHALAIDPVSTSTIYTGTDGGVFKSTDGGNTWVGLAIEPVNLNNTTDALVIDPANTNTVYAVLAYRGIFKSTDAGSTWNAINTGLGGNPYYFANLVIDPTNTSTLYTAVTSTVYKSIDGGAHWNATSNGLATAPNGAVYLAIDSKAPNVIYVGSDFGVFKSVDAGGNWVQVNHGLIASDVNVVAIDSTNPSTIYAGTPYDGLFKSTDTGETWVRLTSGLLENGVSGVSSLAIDPHDSNVVYASTNGYSCSNCLAGAIFKSTNGGASWTSLNFPGGELLIDPANSQVIYTNSGQGPAAFPGPSKSLDGGLTWTALNNGLPGDPYLLAMAPSTSSTLYAADYLSTKLFETTNSGDSWTLVNSRLPVSSIGPMVIDPVTPTTLYIGDGTNANVFKSTDGGATWQSMSSGIVGIYVYSLAIDPVTPTTIYAGTTAGVYKTTDGGAHWGAFNNGLTSPALTIALNPKDTSVIYAGTFGGGVFTNQQGPPPPTPTPTPTVNPTPTPSPSCTPPSIINQPSNETIMSGLTGVVEVLAGGTAPLSYQWYMGLSGDTTNPITDPRGQDSGYATGTLTSTTSYWVRVSNSCGHADSNTATVTVRLPLIFIPGIAGSKLDEVGFGNVWPGTGGYSTFKELGRLSLAPNHARNIIVPDIIRISPEPEDVYDSLINNLVSQDGYSVYDYKDDPNLRTFEGCDLSQAPNNPSLFVFPFDWRQGVTRNVDPSLPSNVDLLGKYIDCIRRFYPGVKVNILAHSQGGLLARSYILAHPSDVDKLITIATPWLGAPKAINVMEEGRFIDLGPATGGWLHDIEGNVGQASLDSTFKNLAKFFPGVHELLPSRSYFTASPASSPYIVDNNSLNYDQFVHFLDGKFQPSIPGTNNSNLHDTPLQDDWTNDNTPVQYFHIYGRKPIKDTIGQVSIENTEDCDIQGVCLSSQNVDLSYTLGDGTVPLLSATRKIGNKVNLNAQNAVVFRPAIPSYPGNTVDHGGLVRNTKVQNVVMCILDASTTQQSNACLGGFTPTQAQPTDETKIQQDSGGQLVVNSEEDTSSQPAYYVSIRGAETVTLADDSGNSITPYPFRKITGNGLPDATVNILGNKSAQFILPTDQIHTITFSAGSDPLSLEVLLAGDTATQAIRYKDLNLPAGTTAMLKITQQGVQTLLHDKNGDGNFGTAITPTVSVTGSAAQDTDPPVVSITSTAQQSNQLVTITATDTSSGVKTMYYSLDGTNFQPYTAPISLDPFMVPAVYAFADDNVANRSSLITYYLPITSNPIDNAQFFVHQHYVDFLNREPDQSGLSFWTHQISDCGSDQQCIGDKRINVSAAYFLSTEFQQTGYLVYRLYKASYGRMLRFQEFLPDTQEIGQGVVVGQTGWEQQLETNKVTFVNGFVSRTAFLAQYPMTLTPAQYVDALNANTGTSLTQGQRDALVNGLTTGAETRATVLRKIAENQTFTNNEFNRAFVLMQYFGYLRRSPDDPPDNNLDGLNFWLNKLNRFNGDYIAAQMVLAFISSKEYRQRFGQP